MVSTDLSIVATISKLFFEPLKTRNSDHIVPEWRPVAWLYALIIPIVLYLFEAVRIISYPALQSQNVGLGVQLSLLLTFFMVWVFVPRAVWFFAVRLMRRENSRWSHIMLILAVLGVLLSFGHTLLGLFFSVVIKSQENWELLDYSRVYGQIWLGCIGNWFMLYSCSVAIFMLIYGLLNREKTIPTRYEVKQNGKTMSVPLSDVYWAKSTGDYVELYTALGVLTVRKSLSQLTTDFGDSGFIKSHRGVLVNGAHVVAVKQQKHGTGYLVQLSSGDEAPLSRRKLSAFKEALKFTRP